MAALLKLPEIDQLIIDHRTTLVQTVAKLMNQKDMVGEAVYEGIEEVVERLKELITAGEFYMEIQNMKQRKREKEMSRKAEFQQMAITQPEKYSAQKVMNNRKKVKK